MVISNKVGQIASVAVTSAIVCLSVGNQAQAFVVTFDDISTNNQDIIPNGYAGFNWNNFYYINQNSFPNSGYNKGTVTESYTAFNWFANPASISSASEFLFNGAYLTAAWNNGVSILVNGIRNGVVTNTKTVTVDTTSPTWFDFNFNNVDTLYFQSYGGTKVELGGDGPHFAMDNFTINQTAAVPEPEGGIALVPVVGVLGYLIRRKFKKKAALKSTPI